MSADRTRGPADDHNGSSPRDNSSTINSISAASSHARSGKTTSHASIQVDIVPTPSRKIDAAAAPTARASAEASFSLRSSILSTLLSDPLVALPSIGQTIHPVNGYKLTPWSLASSTVGAIGGERAEQPQQATDDARRPAHNVRAAPENLVNTLSVNTAPAEEGFGGRWLLLAQGTRAIWGQALVLS